MHFPSALHPDSTSTRRTVHLKHEVPQPKKSNVHNFTHKMGRDLDFKATLLTFSNNTPSSHPIRIKRGFAAFIPALAGLATIAVESIGSFLQKKHNAAPVKGIKAIKSDQKLAWNSVKQLEDDFLMYGKYNLDSLERIVHTINHLGDGVHHMESPSDKNTVFAYKLYWEIAFCT